MLPVWRGEPATNQAAHARFDGSLPSQQVLGDLCAWQSVAPKFTSHSEELTAIQGSTQLCWSGDFGPLDQIDLIRSFACGTRASQRFSFVLPSTWFSPFVERFAEVWPLIHVSASRSRRWVEWMDEIRRGTTVYQRRSATPLRHSCTPVVVINAKQLKTHLDHHIRHLFHTSSTVIWPFIVCFLNAAKVFLITQSKNAHARSTWTQV